jgi:CHAD domain-containing protein
MTPDAPFAAAWRAAMGTALGLARASAAAAKSDANPLHLHDYRVAIRIQRALLGAFKAALPVAARDALRRRLNRLVSTTGTLRDLDVLLEARPGLEQLVPSRVRGQLGAIFATLETRRDRERMLLVARLGGRAHARALDAIQSGIDAMRPARACRTRRAGEVVAEALAVRRKRLDKRARQVAGRATDDAVHALRIEGKKLRYVIEFFQMALPSARVGELLRTLKSAQNVLGHAHDLACQQTAFLDLLDASRDARDSAAEAEAATRLVAALRREQRAWRKKVKAAASILLGRRFQRRLDALATSV